MFSRKPVLFIFFFIFYSILPAQTKTVQFGQTGILPRQDEAMKKWRANRFGQFIHWGLYSIPGGVWNGKTYSYAAEFLKESAALSSATWDSLRFTFNPEKFEPLVWAKMAKEMGAKYVTITTKHHEGFCLWPSKFTDFTISSTPFKEDLLKKFIDAYTAEGIDVNLYYSVLDWHNTDWRYDLKNKEDTIAFERYKTFVKNQLTELVENYPKIKGLWFDGTWDESWKKNGKFSYELEVGLKKIHPGLIVNSRMRADEFGSRHRDSNGKLMGDYESGYERKLPDPWDTKVTENDWECCMTIPENQWGYHKDWTLSHIKTAEELIEMMVQCVSQGGNFLLNFGPKPDGTFREEEQSIAKQIGAWMKENGEVIYDCGYSGLKKQDWGFYTRSAINGKINMVIFNQPVTGKYRVQLPKGRAIGKLYLLQDKTKKIQIEKLSATDYFIIPPATKKNLPFTIILEIRNTQS